MALLPEEARREKILAALAAHDPGQEERVRVPWKDSSQLCPVVEIPLEAAALNPKSHRIRSELESHPHADEIKTDPFSDESQEWIAQILRDTEGFAALKESLAEEGQRDHGVITEAGLLVNANTRAIALSEVGQGHIKVAVLPADAGEREIADLEIRLQMQRDLKQDYSFTNELLFIEDLLTGYGYPTDQVAGVLRRPEREVEQAVRMLALIRDIQQRSGDGIPLTFFDDKEQALKDLDQAYEPLRLRDPEAAQRLKDNRVLGLLVEAGYRELREADENFVEDYLIPAIEERETLTSVEKLLREGNGIGGGSEGAEEPEGVGVLLGGEERNDGNGNGEPNVAPLVELLAQNHREEHVTLPGDDGPEEVERESLVQALNEVVRDAAEEAKADRRKEKGLSGPIARLKDARRATKKARDEYRKVAGDQGFDHGKFEYEARKLHGDVEAVQAEIEKQRS